MKIFKIGLGAEFSPPQRHMLKKYPVYLFFFIVINFYILIEILKKKILINYEKVEENIFPRWEISFFLLNEKTKHLQKVEEKFEPYKRYFILKISQSLKNWTHNYLTIKKKSPLNFFFCFVSYFNFLFADN